MSLIQQIRSFFLGLFFLAIASGMAGSILWSRTFVKFKWGPFFILEWIFLISLFCIPWGKKITPTLAFSVKALRFFYPFLIYCGLRFIYDFTHFRPGIDNDWHYFLQHLIIFIYPFIWIFCGFILDRVSPKNANFIPIVALIASMGAFIVPYGFQPNLFFYEIIHSPWWVPYKQVNLSIGPIIIIPFLFFLNEALKFRKTLDIALTLFFGFFSYFPFWIMWGHQMQRTSLILFLLGIFFGSQFIFKKNYRLTTLLYFFLILGFFTKSLIEAVFPNQVLIQNSNNFYTQVSRDFFKSVRHGDDINEHEELINWEMEEAFKVKTRRFFWNTAIQDWKTHPILGIGFIPEVPSLIREGVENKYGTQGPHMPPVNGPHNSYLTILVRTGIIGLGLFFVFILNILSRGYKLLLKNRQTPHFAELTLCYSVFCSLIFAIIHTGFESPYNAFPLWIFIGILVSKTEKRGAT